MVKYWGVIPAAGIGQRMNSQIPKQFMQLGNRKLIEWAVQALASHKSIQGVYIGLSANNKYSDWVMSIHEKVLDVYEGGSSRSQTVLNGINHMLARGCSSDDWLLVHDSNRPFLSPSEITGLIQQIGDDINGGILSQPIFDTMKLESSGRIRKTLPRGELFRAQTPQMFKLGTLRKALEDSIESGSEVTDEAQAMERSGYHPRLVPGHSANIKITTSEDLTLAQAMLNLDLVEQ